MDNSNIKEHTDAKPTDFCCKFKNNENLLRIEGEQPEIPEIDLTHDFPETTRINRERKCCCIIDLTVFDEDTVNPETDAGYNKKESATTEHYPQDFRNIKASFFDTKDKPSKSTDFRSSDHDLDDAHSSKEDVKGIVHQTQHSSTSGGNRKARNDEAKALDAQPEQSCSKQQSKHDSSWSNYGFQTAAHDDGDNGQDGPSEDDIRYGCLHCSYHTSNRARFVKHYRYEHHRHCPTFKCRACAYSSKCHADFLEHRPHHEGVKALLCETCGRRTNGKVTDGRRARVARVVAMPRCALCEQVSENEAGLRKRRKHQQGDPMGCLPCGCRDKYMHAYRRKRQPAHGAPNRQP